MDANIQLLGPLPDLDYFDQRSVMLPVAITVLEAWNLMMSEPLPLLRLAFLIRDTVSAPFGVRRIAGFSGKQRMSVSVGDHLDFFLVEHATPDAMALTSRDRHLDVMTCLSMAGRTLTITSSVITHNRFGRAYMLPVGPAHKLIVAAMLRRLKRALEHSRQENA